MEHLKIFNFNWQRIHRWFVCSVMLIVFFYHQPCFARSSSAGNKGGPTFKVVAYMPAWSGTADEIQYKKITHINYAYVRPTVEGGLTILDNPQKLRDIVTKAHANGTLVGIAVGGWDNLKNDDFEGMAAKAQYRTAFINNVLSLIQQYQLDGVDIDWEYPANAGDQSNFSALLTELGSAVHAKGKYLSAAVAANGHYADGIQTSVFDAVDFLNLLAYDGGADVDHSPFNYAASSLSYWKDRGLPADKAILGIPFHARPTWKSFKTVVAEGGNPTLDTHNGNYYNGIYTVVQKTDLAFDRTIGGVMISNLSQDASGSNSLVNALSNVITRRTVNTTFAQGPYEGLIRTLPGTIEAEHYDLGGEGIGYHDLTTGNAGGTFRYDNVDVEVNTNMIEDYKVSGIEAGEWLSYSVTVTTSGALTLHASVAAVTADKTFHIELNGIDITGKLTVPNTGGWQNWQTITATTPYLTKGKKTMRIVMDSGGFNINKVAFYGIDLSPSTVAENSTDESIAEIKGLALHPNPGYSGGSQNVTLTFEGDQKKLSVFINDINGYGVFAQSYDEVNGKVLDMTLPNLSPGIYTIRIQGEQKSWAKKYMVK